MAALQGHFSNPEVILDSVSARKRGRRPYVLELRTVTTDDELPQITIVEYPAAPFDWLVFEVYDRSPGITLNMVLIRLGNEGDEETGVREAAYDEGAFRGRYVGSSLTGAGTQGNPYRFSIRPRMGWPTLTDGKLHNLLPRIGDGIGNIQIGPTSP